MVQKSFEDIIIERRKWYYSLNSVHCKYLREPVKFNSHGFRHTLRDGRGHYRRINDALMRLNLLILLLQLSIYYSNTLLALKV